MASKALSVLGLLDPSGISQIRMILSILCGVHWAARILLVAILPLLFAPLSLPFWLLFVVPIHFTDNSMNKDKTTGEKSFKNSFLAAYGIFWAICTVLSGLSLIFACKANAVIPGSFS